jgi:alanine-glyoxylate transaminase/serine-glyoxylate transaminase/serine-pyruvate transaminase
MGLKLLVDPQHRPWTIHTVCVPGGVDDAKIRRRLLEDSNIDIAGGLGLLKGKLWRIGLMGSGSTRENVFLALNSLHRALDREGHKCNSGIEAAESVYRRESN